jgi:hypothetical protein
MAPRRGRGHLVRIANKWGSRSRTLGVTRTAVARYHRQSSQCHHEHDEEIAPVRPRSTEQRGHGQRVPAGSANRSRSAVSTDRRRREGHRPIAQVHPIRVVDHARTTFGTNRLLRHETLTAPLHA